jgi:hypothetical protein
MFSQEPAGNIDANLMRAQRLRFTVLSAALALNGQD